MYSRDNVYIFLITDHGNLSGRDTCQMIISLVCQQKLLISHTSLLGSSQMDLEKKTDFVEDKIKTVVSEEIQLWH